jgi:hypothetical protein
MKIKLNPYKIGMNFYIILIVFVVTLFGCKTFEKYDQKRKIKQEAQEILNTPNLK